MTSYVTFTMRTDTFDQLMDNLRTYCNSLDNYYDIEDTVHLIDYMYEEYFNYKEEEDKQFKQWQEYEKLFLERFESEEFKDDAGNINKTGMNEYKNFNKLNKVIEKYKDYGSLEVLDDKQQFFLILDIINCISKKKKKI